MSNKKDIFPKKGRWIWSGKDGGNDYVLFRKVLNVSDCTDNVLVINITASYYYELFINGQFINRGPVYGDPKWCQYDTLEYAIDAEVNELEIVVIVHHCQAKVLSLLSSPGGLLGEFQVGEYVWSTDQSWQYLILEMWRNDTPKMGWALGQSEWYDARYEPQGWQDKMFYSTNPSLWQNALNIENADEIWGGYCSRITPLLKRQYAEPILFKAFIANSKEYISTKSLSEIHDCEALEEITDFIEFDIDIVNSYLKKANCFTFDLGVELVGHISFEIESQENTIIEISTAERLRNGRPLVFNRDEYYTSRYLADCGRRKFTTFSWTGLRYLHIVIRGQTEKLKIFKIGCDCKVAPLKSVSGIELIDEKQQKIFDICEHTLKICAQEHLIDCPTREQMQYWGDGVFIAQTLWHLFGKDCYLKWYLECFIHCPFNSEGLLSAVYPGLHDQWILLDYTLIPAIGQQFYKLNTGEFYRPDQFFKKAIRLNKWFEANKNINGLIEFDVDKYIETKRIRIFIDHPGIGWHKFPHPGIDRKGISCGLNIFYYNFLNTIAQIAKVIEDDMYLILSHQALQIKDNIIRLFYDGLVFHDAIDKDILSPFTSWQTNALAVCFDIVEGQQGRKMIEYIIQNSDKLCRCTPYFYFYMFAAMEKIGMQQQALSLLKDQWSCMIDNKATTTWETFCGNDIDSLCHPWSTAPVLFLLNKSNFS